MVLSISDHDDIKLILITIILSLTKLKLGDKISPKLNFVK